LYSVSYRIVSELEAKLSLG